MVDAKVIAGSLGPDEADTLIKQGYAYGRTQYHPMFLRPLARQGLMRRVDHKGFRSRWEMTELGLQVCALLKGTNNGPG